MKNIFSSPAQQDLQNIVQLVTTKLETIQKDVLYITYRTDRILKVLTEMRTSPQTDQYYEEQTDDTSVDQ